MVQHDLKAYEDATAAASSVAMSNFLNLDSTDDLHRLGTDDAMDLIVAATSDPSVDALDKAAAQTAMVNTYFGSRSRLELDQLTGETDRTVASMMAGRRRTILSALGFSNSDAKRVEADRVGGDRSPMTEAKLRYYFG